MPTAVPEGYGRVIHSFSLSGDAQPFAVTYGLIEVDPPIDTPNDIAAAVHDAFGDLIVPELTNVITLTQTEVYLQRTGPNYGPGEAAPLVGTAVLNRVGGEAGQSAVQNTAYLVHKRTSFGGRRGRGRWYLPGVAEGDVSPAGAVGSGRVTSMNAALAAWLLRWDLTGSDLDGYFPVILHSYDPDADPPAISDPTLLPPPHIITSMNLDGLAATQRRRLRK